MMFYHDDGLPDEDAFTDYLVNMKHGDEIEAPNGMRRNVLELCVGAAEFRSPLMFSIKRRVVKATLDPYVYALYNLQPEDSLHIGGDIVLKSHYTIAIRKMRGKSKYNFKIKEGRICCVW
jgi:hypothetical protein